MKGSAEAAALALSIAAEDEAFAAALDETMECAVRLEESGDVVLKSGDAEVAVPAAMIDDEGEPDEPAEGESPEAPAQE
jgi:hypothetical protein